MYMIEKILQINVLYNNSNLFSATGIKFGYVVWNFYKLKRIESLYCHDLSKQVQ